MAGSSVGSVFRALRNGHTGFHSGHTMSGPTCFLLFVTRSAHVRHFRLFDGGGNPVAEPRPGQRAPGSLPGLSLCQTLTPGPRRTRTGPGNGA